MPQPRKRLVVISLQELGRAVCGLPIGVGFGGMIGGSPVDEAGEDGIGFELRPVDRAGSARSLEEG